MILVRCSQRLLKRLHARPMVEEPALSGNPLGEWAADIDFIDREPFVLLLNAATGALLVLRGRAADLKCLHEQASAQLALLLDACGIKSPMATLELAAWRQPPRFARNGNRSIVASMNLLKREVWLHLASDQGRAADIAIRFLERPFSRRDLGGGFHFAANRLRARLLPKVPAS